MFDLLSDDRKTKEIGTANQNTTFKSYPDLKKVIKPAHFLPDQKATRDSVDHKKQETSFNR